MSVDFGGTVFAKVKKESLDSLKYVENLGYYKDSWSDNKCGPADGYLREDVAFETENNVYHYIINNSIFSGFVQADRVLVRDKKTNTEKNYKLKKQDTSVKIPDMASFLALSKEDYEKNQCENFDSFGDSNGLCVPSFKITNNQDDYIMIEAKINDSYGYIGFKINETGLVNAFYYNENFGIKTLSLEEVTNEEYIEAAFKANQVLALNEGKNASEDTYLFKEQLSIVLSTSDEDYDDDYYDDYDEDYEDEENDDEENDDEENDDEEETNSIKDMCEDAVQPFIPKLDLAEYKDNTLVMPKGCDYLSYYLVRFILHSLNITSDDDLNNYSYDDYKLNKLNLDLIIPGNIKVIGDGAFQNKRFRSITIEEGTEIINYSAFSGVGAQLIKLPKSIQTIDRCAFRYNPMTEISLSENVSFISGTAFFGCSKLEKIRIDENNKKYQTNMLGNVIIEKDNQKLIVALRNADVPEGVKIIGEDCFSDNKVKKEFVIPEGVEIIEDYTFIQCCFTKIVFPETLKEIGRYVGQQCNNLTELVFPKSLKKLGKNSFVQCNNLQDVYFNSDVSTESTESNPLFFRYGSEVTIHGRDKK